MTERICNRRATELLKVEARRLAEDNVLLDPTDAHILTSAAEMVEVTTRIVIDLADLADWQRQDVVRAYDTVHQIGPWQSAPQTHGRYDSIHDDDEVAA